MIEVIIAAGILFSCLFAILAVLSGALRNARALQQKKTELMGMAASEIYAMLVNTNQVSEGTGKGDFGDAYPEYRYEWALQEVGTNGLCQVDIALQRSRNVDSSMSILLFLPTVKKNDAPAPRGPTR